MALVRKSIADKDKQRLKRKSRIRGVINGTTERPRLSVFRSSKHIYAQVIDDLAGKTVASTSSVDKELALKHGAGFVRLAFLGVTSALLAKVAFDLFR